MSAEAIFVVLVVLFYGVGATAVAFQQWRHRQALRQVAQALQLNREPISKRLFGQRDGFELSVERERNTSTGTTVTAITMMSETGFTTEYIDSDALRPLVEELNRGATLSLGECEIRAAMTGPLRGEVLQPYVERLVRLGQALSLTGPAELVEAAQNAHDPEGQRRAFALLLECHARAPETRALVKQMLSGSDPNLEAQAYATLGADGRDRLSQIVEDRERPLPQRERAYGTLLRLGRHWTTTETLERLLVAGEDPTLRLRAVRALVEQKEPIPRDVRQVLAAGGIEEAKCLAEALGREHLEPDTVTLLALVARVEGEVQEAALNALAKVGPASVVADLLALRARVESKGVMDRAVRRIQARTQGIEGSLTLLESAGDGQLSVAADAGSLALDHDHAQEHEHEHDA